MPHEGCSTAFWVLLGCGRRYEPLTADPVDVVARQLRASQYSQEEYATLWASLRPSERADILRAWKGWQGHSVESLLNEAATAMVPK